MKLDPENLSASDTHELLTATIAPRPIAFVSTVGEDGVYNLAPFSLFNAICVKPSLVGFSIAPGREGRKKDTLQNIEATGEFVLNVVSEDIAQAMNQASYAYPSEVDEFKEVGLTPLKADLVRAPMVAESLINLECRLQNILELGEAPAITSFVIGEVLRLHVKDELYAGGNIEMSRLKTIGRLGGELYCRTRDIFEMKRPYPYV